MSARDPQETEVNAITFHCADMARSVAFYEALGFGVGYGGRESEFTTMRIVSPDESAAERRGAMNFVNLQLVPGFSQPSGSWGRVVLHVPDPDAVFERLGAGGVEAEFAPRNAPWGERYFHVRDPDGHELSFARLLTDEEVAELSSG